MANEGPRDPGPVDRLALLMLAEWRRVEPDKPVGPCLMATIADLARVAVVACGRVPGGLERLEQDLAAAVAERDRALARVAELEAALEVTHATVDRVADLVGY